MSQEYKELLALDKFIHEPARLSIMAVLYACESADFKYLLNATGLTRGNLSSHVAKLEEGGYVTVNKSFRGKIPFTAYSLTPQGRGAFTDYWEQWQKIAKRVELKAGD